jgi:MFS family permease
MPARLSGPLVGSGFANQHEVRCPVWGSASEHATLISVNVPKTESALLLIGERLLSPARGGLGYMLFSIAMTVGRFIGDGVVARWGNRVVLTLSGLSALLGFFILLLSPLASAALGSFILIGLGAANIVPILFRLAGTQHAMPKGLAIAALTTAGDGGLLTGPAVIGFLSKEIGLHNAFWFLAALLVCVPALCKYVASEGSGERAL